MGAPPVVFQPFLRFYVFSHRAERAASTKSAGFQPFLRFYQTRNVNRAVAVPCEWVAFQPFLRFYTVYSDVLTEREYVSAFQPFLRFWTTTAMSRRGVLAMGGFQPFLRF